MAVDQGATGQIIRTTDVTTVELMAEVVAEHHDDGLA